MRRSPVHGVNGVPSRPSSFCITSGKAFA